MLRLTKNSAYVAVVSSLPFCFMSIRVYKHRMTAMVIYISHTHQDRILLRGFYNSQQVASDGYWVIMQP